METLAIKSAKNVSIQLPFFAKRINKNETGKYLRKPAACSDPPTALNLCHVFLAV